jgi:hypothetical protein
LRADCGVASRQEPNDRLTGSWRSSVLRVRITDGGYGEPAAGHTVRPSRVTEYAWAASGIKPVTTTRA